MNIYSVVWKDGTGREHSQCFSAPSPSGAISEAIVRIDELAKHPNRITRVLLECECK